MTLRHFGLGRCGAIDLGSSLRLYQQKRGPILALPALQTKFQRNCHRRAVARHTRSSCRIDPRRRSRSIHGTTSPAPLLRRGLHLVQFGTQREPIDVCARGMGTLNARVSTFVLAE